MKSSATRRKGLVAPIVTAAIVVTTMGFGAIGPVTAAPQAGRVPDSQIVVSGDARFEVLSPTLIRTEYAADGTFDDDPTFNVIGRDGFTPTPYESSVDAGWLTIDTGSVTLRYEVGSGNFDSDNLSLSLTMESGQQVTASPWRQSELPACAVGVLCEAEELQLEGLGLATDHTGFTGKGFAAGYEAVGNSATFAVTADRAGAYDLALRYANAQAGDGLTKTRTLTVTVDGTNAQTVQLPPSGSWDTWALLTASIDLPQGKHTVRIERTANDSGSVNIDSLAVLEPGSAYPGVLPLAPVDCAFGTVCEAETSVLQGGASAAVDHNGYSGDGFVAGLAQGASQTVHVTDVPAVGQYAVQLRYASGQPDARTVTVQSGENAQAVASLPPTSGWDYWRTVPVVAELAAGDNDVTIGCPDESSCQLNIDTVAVTGADDPLLAPHAALGGYRRDLDTANGTVPTNPGLLYQDGWSLLDDTASALYDSETETLTPRGDHGGAYQDGYLFGYGSDYERALGELATLTGPSLLLPRWAYGVWYSEYYDRTQTEFADTIVPRFAEEGVPLDVLAVDTDYKSPDKWNGWNIDESRFPDLKGFLADLKAQGIHNTLNVHPSISNNDPKLAEAQATANNALIPDGSRYLFDWADPAQLKAYFDLHSETESAGVDAWWLDWCCSDSSRYSAEGITPDAFINHEYATRADDRMGRGFAFSRAYGALTAGGYGNPQAVPTGPWADKRTTLHFTGDTVSTWRMLQAQVGYTPGESASTGLSAVSHDIGGHTGGETLPGAEPESSQLAADLYARWVQFGTFQPIDRLHSNHSDRLPWQYNDEANASANKFLNLRENLMPLTYTLAADATRTGVPVVRPLYLQYPEQEEAYALAGSEYLYGPDVLVAPVTTPGSTATTPVWFPAGSDWTDYFTGETHPGGSTAQVTTTLDTMPVFVRSGGIVPARTHNVANDEKNPLTDVTLTAAGGADGSYTLYEDDGVTTDPAASATTEIAYSQNEDGGTLQIAPSEGRFDGQVTERAWTVAFTNASEPQLVTVDGVPIAADAWSYDGAARSVTVTLPSRPIAAATTVSYSTEAQATPLLTVGKDPVTAGTDQTVTGSGFPANTEVALTTAPDLGGMLVTTDASGGFTTELPIPASAAGPYSVLASVNGTELARAAFTVEAADPGDGTPGGGTPGDGTPGDGAGPGNGSPGTGGGNGDGSNTGGLPLTGLAVGGIGLAAAALLALGGALAYRSRRRRHS